MNERPHGMGTFRIHMVLTAGLVVLTFSAIAALLIFVPLVSRFGAGSPDSAGNLGLAEYILFLHESFWPVVACSVLASMASGMVLFERMRSPLRRLRRVYAQIAEGKIPAPISIRAVDYLRDEMDELNLMLETLRQHQADQTGALERIGQGLQELDACELPAKETGMVAELQEALTTLRQNVGG